MTYVCAVFGFSNFLGLFLTLSIEVPIASLCKLILLKKDVKEETQEIPMSEVNRNQ